MIVKTLTPNKQKRLAVIAGWTAISNEPPYRTLRPYKPDKRLWGYPPEDYPGNRARRLLPNFDDLNEMMWLVIKLSKSYTLVIFPEKLYSAHLHVKGDPTVEGNILEGHSDWSMTKMFYDAIVKMEERGS